MGLLLSLCFVGDDVFVVLVYLALGSFNVRTPTYDFNKETLVFEVDSSGLIFLGYELVVAEVPMGLGFAGVSAES